MSPPIGASARSLQRRLPAKARSNTFIPDGVWTWFTGPRAYFDADSNKILTGGVSETGHIEVASYDRDTGVVNHNTVHTNLEEPGDDHDSPSFLVRDSDKKILVTYTAHASSTPLKYRISDNPQDITSFGAEQELTGNGTAWSYSQIVQLSAVTDQPIYWFFRDRFASYLSLSFFKSTDGGATWSGPTELIRSSASGHTEYWRVGTNWSDRIDLALTDSEGPGADPKQDAKHIYMDGSSIYGSDGTLLADETDTEPLTSHAAATMVYDSEASGNAHAWVHDCDTNGGNPEIVFAELNSTTDHDWWYARWNGTSWDTTEVTSAGGTIVDTGVSNEGYYSAGASLDIASEGRIYLCVGDNSGSSLERWDTEDNGGTWSSTQLKDASTQRIRPVVPQSPSGTVPSDIPVVYLDGVYDDYFGDNYDMASKIPDELFPPTDPIIQWSFNESSLGDVTSALDRKYNVPADTVGDNVTPGATGQFGSAFDFAGSSPNYLQARHGRILDLGSDTDEFAIAVWFQPDDVSNDDRILIDDWHDDGTDEHFILRIESADSKLHFYVDDGGTAKSITSDTTIAADGTWYHAIVGVRPTGDGALILDGVEEGTPFSVTSGIGAGGGVFRVGQNDKDSQDPYSGVLDELWVFDTFPTDTEIDSLINENSV